MHLAAPYAEFPRQAAFTRLDHAHSEASDPARWLGDRAFLGAQSPQGGYASAHRKNAGADHSTRESEGTGV